MASDDVTAWLAGLGLEKYAATFVEQEIDLEAAAELDDGDLADLGIPLGPRKKILKAIRALPADVASTRTDHAQSDTPAYYTPQFLARRIRESRPSVEGERKQVTILFADIKGSTELIEDLDAERAGLTMDPVLKIMMDAVHRYEGTVNRMQGDGLMAMFGAPLAHEDHALRACYAALAMQESIRSYAEEQCRDGGVSIETRVGLHSGEVVVRTIHNDLSIHPLVDLVRRWFSIEEDDGAPEIVAKLTEGVQRIDEALAPVLPYLRYLLSVDPGEESVGAMDARHRRLELFRALRQLIARAAELEPIVLVLEDLHWIDKATEDFLAFLLDAVTASRILCVFTYRPGYTHPFGATRTTPASPSSRSRRSTPRR